MIKSMTGYGKANLSKDLREYQIDKVEPKTFELSDI